VNERVTTRGHDKDVAIIVQCLSAMHAHCNAYCRKGTLLLIRHLSVMIHSHFITFYDVLSKMLFAQ